MTSARAGRISTFNLAEFDPYAEMALPGRQRDPDVRRHRLHLSQRGISPTSANDSVCNSDSNTWELYGKAEFDVTLFAPLAVYYDIDKIDGAYIEAGVAIPPAEREGRRSIWARSSVSPQDRMPISTMPENPRRSSSTSRKTALLTSIFRRDCR